MFNKIKSKFSKITLNIELKQKLDEIKESLLKKENLNWFIFLILCILGLVIYAYEKCNPNSIFTVIAFGVFSGLLLRGITNLVYTKGPKREQLALAGMSCLFVILTHNDALNSIKSKTINIVNLENKEHYENSQLFTNRFYLTKINNGVKSTTPPYISIFFPSGTTDESGNLSEGGYKLSDEQKNKLYYLAKAFDTCASNDRIMEIQIFGYVSSSKFKTKKGEVRRNSADLNLELANNRAKTVYSLLKDRVSSKNVTMLPPKPYESLDQITPNFIDITDSTRGKNEQKKNERERLNQSAVIYLKQTGNCSLMGVEN